MLIKEAPAYGNKSVTLKHFQKQVVRSLGVGVGWDSRERGNLVWDCEPVV